MRLLLLLFMTLPQTLGNINDNVVCYVVNESIDRFLNPPTIKKVIKETVVLTTYSPTVEQTDSTPNITASGFKINMENPKDHKIIAVSRDLKSNGWTFGKKVRIEGSERFNGVYTIQDLMNKRFKKRIDILIGEDDGHTKLYDVEITLLD